MKALDDKILEDFRVYVVAIYRPIGINLEAFSSIHKATTYINKHLYELTEGKKLKGATPIVKEEDVRAALIDKKELMYIQSVGKDAWICISPSNKGDSSILIDIIHHINTVLNIGK